MSDLPLKDKRIVITRPKHQAHNLRKRLETAGAKVILFPLIEIGEPDDPSLVAESLKKTAKYDLAVFVSPNAVEKTLDKMSSEDFSSMKIAAIGEKTASTLKNHGIDVDFLPTSVFNSEALLKVPELQFFIKGKEVVIIRGSGGREHLKSSLVALGARVEYINVYQRFCPQMDLLQLSKHYQNNEIDMMLITSGASIESLYSFYSNNYWLDDVNLLVGSQRIKDLVIKNTDHAGKILVAEDPSDSEFYRQLLYWSDALKSENNG